MTSKLTDKERLDAQERAIQMLAYYFDISDAGFSGYVEDRVRAWTDASDANVAISETEKAAARAQHEEILRLLRPGRQHVG